MTSFKIKPIFTKPHTSSETTKISAYKRYLVGIGEEWYIGYFHKEWYGWTFEDWGTSGIALDAIDEVYELEIKQRKTKSIRSS